MTPVLISEDCQDSVRWSFHETWASGVPLQVSPPLLFSTDTSWSSLGSHLQDLTVGGLWSSEKDRQTNIWEMKAVLLSLNALLPMIMGESVVLMSKNAQ